MDLYKEKIVQFLSDSNNYRYAKSITKFIPDVDNYLIEKFWDTVRIGFLHCAGSEWLAEYKSDRNSDNLNFLKKSWNEVSITFRSLKTQPHFGLYCNKLGFKNEHVIEAENQTKSIFNDYILDRENVVWISYQFLNIDWKIEENIDKILSDNLELFTKTYIDLAWDYARKVEVIADSLNSSKRIWES